MKSFTHVVADPAGIHAHPAGKIVAKVKSFPASVITAEKDGKAVNMSKLMALMGMGIRNGDEVTITVEGGDEEAVAAEIQAFLKENL